MKLFDGKKLEANTELDDVANLSTIPISDPSTYVREKGCMFHF